MAEQKKKKTAAGGASGGRTSGGKSSSAGKSASRSNAAREAAARERANKARIRRRRSYGALFLACLGVFTLLGYFTTDGVIIRFLRGVLTGLFGGGFYLLPPMLLAAAVFLAVGREGVAGKVTACLSVPVLVAAFCQLFAGTYELEWKMFASLWADGKQLVGGGAVGGAAALVCKKLFSTAGAAILLSALSVLALMSLSGLTLGSLIEHARERKKAREQREIEAYMNEPEPEPEPERRKTAAEARAAGAAQPVSAARRRSAIDIPMDGDEPSGKAEADAQAAPGEEKRKSFFNKKQGAPSPDTVFTRASAEKEEPEPEPEPEIKVPQTVEVIRRETSAFDVPAPVIPAASTVRDPAVRDPAETAPVPPAPVVSAGEARSAGAGEGTSLIRESARRDMAEAAQEYKFPPISLLNEPVRSGSRDSQDELAATKERLELCLRSFGVNVTVSNIVHGPSITRYEMELEIGVKLNKLTNLADDIALALGVTGVRIAAIPNRISTVGIEVPNKNVSTVYLREIISSPEFKNAKSKLTFAIGKNISGDVMVGNISKLPHLLVAGTTGSGKSVCLNSLILSLMYKASPEEVKFIMVDPKMVEFKIYNGIPHLLIPVVTEAKKAAGALQWAVVEMMKRYRLFSDAGARDLAGYNAQLAPDQPKIPQIVVIIDELADLMMIAAKEVEESICRVAQMGRAAGVHLVIATQSPRADVITGLMKANIPSRIALKVASSLESRIILDAGGAADKLVGNGDMLYAPIGASKPVRIQGTWVSDEEREAVIEYVKRSSGEATYSEDVIYEIEKAAAEKESGGKGAPQQAQEDKFKDYDELLPQAAEIIFETKIASVSALQRRLKLGYARAARIVDQLEEVGVLGPFEGSKPRQIIMTYQQWQEMQFVQGTAPIGQTGAGPAAPGANAEQTMFSADDLLGEDE